MKKLLSIILTFSMVFMFTACSADEDEIRGEQISNEEVQEESSDNISETETEFSLGKADGLVYENKFIGIGCSLEEGWFFYSDEEIKEINNYAADVAGEDFEEAMKAADIVYDMYAVSDNQLDNINVNLEKLDAKFLEELDLKENFENQKTALLEAFENMGYKDLKSEVSTVLIDGEEVVSLESYGIIDGLTMYQKIISIKCDGYLSNITVTTYQENLVDSLYENFYFIK